MSRVIVCGSRDGMRCWDLVARALSSFDHDRFSIQHVIVGSLRGVDRAAFDWALKFERSATVVPAHWNDLGKAAGPARNERMYREHKPDAVIAFPGGRGTEHMKLVATRAHCPLWTCEVTGEREDHWQWREVCHV